MAGLLPVRGEDFEWPLIVGGDEEIVGVCVSEITLETGQVLFDHRAHRVIGCFAPAVEWDVNERLR